MAGNNEPPPKRRKTVVSVESMKNILFGNGTDAEVIFELRNSFLNLDKPSVSFYSSHNNVKLWNTN